MGLTRRSKFATFGRVWIVETLNASVDAELEALPDDVLARLHRVVGLIETYGLARVGEPHLGHLEGPLWELPLGGMGPLACAALVHVTARRRRVVVVGVVVKSVRRTPRRQIGFALARARELR